MHIRLIAVGTRMPTWVTLGYQDYAARLPREWRLQLHEVAATKRATKRGKNHDINRLLRDEAQRILAHLPESATAIALAVDGQSWTTEQLAGKLQSWLQQGRDLAFIIGGADGLDHSVLNRCEQHWSLSKLVFPHALVRVMLTEQLFRAWSILNHHPYHRAG